MKQCWLNTAGIVFKNGGGGQTKNSWQQKKKERKRKKLSKLLVSTKNVISILCPTQGSVLGLKKYFPTQ